MFLNRIKHVQLGFPGNNFEHESLNDKSNFHQQNIHVRNYNDGKKLNNMYY